MPTFVRENENGQREIVHVPGRKHTPESLERMADQMVENWARGHVSDDPFDVLHWANYYRRKAKEMRAEHNTGSRPHDAEH